MEKKMAIETKNIIIRESTFEDCAFFAECESTKAISDRFSIDNGWCKEDIEEEFCRRKNSGDGSDLQFTIILKKTMKPIGRLFTPFDRKKEHLHIDWFYIGKEEYRGIGYGEEALRGFLDHCFRELNLERVSIDHFLDNHIAACLYKKVGFVKEGILRHYTKKNDEFFDLMLLSMLREEYIKSNP
ncbi:MAG TPA: GNAT family protein [Bacillota bacterium]|nr:GNAT family protein [Bacillota bacterium]